MKDRIKEVIVVEGVKDTKRIQLYFQADTIETGGSAIDDRVLEQIRHAHEKRGVIVFTDPDTPGERIRKIISQNVEEVSHAFLSQNEARPSRKGSLGIEHADETAIRKALEGLYQESPTRKSLIPKVELMKMGLIGHKDSARLRDQLGAKLRIGHTNGKQLQKRLQMFGISIAQVHDILEEIREEERYG